MAREAVIVRYMLVRIGVRGMGWSSDMEDGDAVVGETEVGMVEAMGGDNGGDERESAKR